MQYQLGPNDRDWRGTGRSLDQALDAAFGYLDAAFGHTGVPRDQFVVT